MKLVKIENISEKLYLQNEAFERLYFTGGCMGDI